MFFASPACFIFWVKIIYDPQKFSLNLMLQNITEEHDRQINRRDGGNFKNDEKVGEKRKKISNVIKFGNNQHIFNLVKSYYFLFVPKYILQFISIAGSFKNI